jgi:hypothetical protein
MNNQQDGPISSKPKLQKEEQAGAELCQAQVKLC